MDQILYDLFFACCYTDDVIIFSKTSQEYVKHLQAVFEWLRRWELRLHHGKCKFFYDWLAYLGHMIIPGGLGVHQAKVDILQKISGTSWCAKTSCFLGLDELLSSIRQEF